MYEFMKNKNKLITLSPENPINSSNLITLPGSNEIIWKSCEIIKHKCQTCIILNSITYEKVLDLCKI